MTKKPLKIIGINPGTRYLGIAVFQDAELLDWRVKVFKGKCSKEKIGKILEIISEYIELYDLNTIALKRLHPSRSSKNLELLVLRIKALAKKNKIKVYQYSIKGLEKFLLEETKHNKKNLAEKMASDYPCLVHELEKEKTHKNRYHQRMFEAVAVGAACFRKALEVMVA
jgi:hypothetical protein